MRVAGARPGGIGLKIPRPECEDSGIVGREARLDDPNGGDGKRRVEDGVVSA